MENKRYGLTDEEIAKLKKAGIADDVITALAAERVEEQIGEAGVYERDALRDALDEKFPDLPESVVDFLVELSMKHPEEAEIAAKTITDYLKEHAADLPEGFDEPGAIFPTKREAAIFWAKKALGENPTPDPYWLGAKMYSYLMADILTAQTLDTENVRKAIEDIMEQQPIY